MVSRRGFTLVEMLVVIVIIAILAALLLPALWKAMCSARDASAEALIDQLSQASACFEHDQAAYPAGNGSGSAALVAALSQPGAKGIPYFVFLPDMTLNGHVQNPARPGEILYYRNNQSNAGPLSKNLQRFDIWGTSCGAVPEGVNNWE